MKIVERVLERMIREVGNVDEIEFDFMLGPGKKDALFVVRRIQR